MENKNVFEIIKEERIQDSAIRLQHRKEHYHNALQNIRNICGKRKNNEYSFADVFLYYQMQYGAKEITFEEGLDYIDLPSYVEKLKHIPSHYKDVIFEITDGSDSNMPDLILRLPPKHDKDIRPALKNGLILALYEKENRLDSWWAAGNCKGYKGLLPYETSIFMGYNAEQCAARRAYPFHDLY